MRITKQALTATVIVALAASAAVATAGQTPVLGAKAFAPNGGGFGTAHPTGFFNGGDPSGYVTKITWTHWGSPTSEGVGRNPIFKPHGGYYAQLARIDLKAYDLGTCPGSKRPAYRRLMFRVPVKPGGRPGPWRSWSGAHTICTMP